LAGFHIRGSSSNPNAMSSIGRRLQLDGVRRYLLLSGQEKTFGLGQRSGGVIARWASHHERGPFSLCSRPEAFYVGS
jgi:hypothetical protein